MSEERYNLYGNDRNINLSPYEIEQLYKLLKYVNAYSNTFLHYQQTGDWIYQILSKLTDDNTTLYKVPVPLPLGIYELLNDKSEYHKPGDCISEINVGVQDYINCDPNEKGIIKFQVIEFLYFIEPHRAVTTINDSFYFERNEIYIVEKEDEAGNHIIKDPLTVGYYSLNDYLIMRAIIDEDFKK